MRGGCDRPRTLDAWTSRVLGPAGYPQAERREEMYIGIGTLLLIVILLVIFL